MKNGIKTEHFLFSFITQQLQHKRYTNTVRKTGTNALLKQKLFTIVREEVGHDGDDVGRRDAFRQLGGRQRHPFFDDRGQGLLPEGRVLPAKREQAQLYLGKHFGDRR